MEDLTGVGFVYESDPVEGKMVLDNTRIGILNQEHLWKD